MLKLLLFVLIGYFLFKTIRFWKKIFEHPYTRAGLHNIKEKQKRTPWKDGDVENADFEEIDSKEKESKG